MAITKSREDEHGYTSSYWYMTGYSVDRGALTATGLFRLYKSDTDRTSGKSPIDKAKATIAVTRNSTVEQIVLALEAEVLTKELSGGSTRAD